MNDELKEIEITDLYGEQRELAELIGLDVYLTLVRMLGGSNIYIAKADKLVNIFRNRKIREEFNGENYSQLAIKYGLSERRVRNIINNLFEDTDNDESMNSNQLTIFSITDEEKK